MNNPIQLTNKIPVVARTLFSRFPLRCGLPRKQQLPRTQATWTIRGLLLIALTLASVVLLPAPKAFGVTPSPDGGYPGQNTAEGEDALFSLTSGTSNTALGFNALHENTTGSANTAIGFDALFSNTTGGENTATGLQALANNTSGFENTANGHNALFSNTRGIVNTATGDHALFSNTTGGENTADGANALFSNTIGDQNTAISFAALHNNTTGNNNTAVGDSALERNTTGSNNVALGFFAGRNLTTGDNNIDIGHRGVAGEANIIRIGTKGTQTATFIAGISDVVVTGSQVVVNAAGKLGVAASSERFKEKIKLMDKASEAILELQPVTFRYRSELDPEGIPQFGLVAEQVEKVNPDLVARDDEGKAYTVRYEAVNAMLLNEFLKEHRSLQELKAAMAQQQAINATYRRQIEALTARVKQISE